MALVLFLSLLDGSLTHPYEITTEYQRQRGELASCSHLYVIKLLLKEYVVVPLRRVLTYMMTSWTGSSISIIGSFWCKDDSCTNSRVVGDFRRHHAHMTSLLYDLCIFAWFINEILFAIVGDDFPDTPRFRTKSEQTMEGTTRSQLLNRKCIIRPKHDAIDTHITGHHSINETKCKWEFTTFSPPLETTRFPIY